MIKDIKSLLEEILEETEDTRTISLVRKIKEKIGYLEGALDQMAEQYSEKRSDVEEYIVGILSGTPLELLEKVPEHRYIKWVFNDTSFMYDTLTTLVDYKNESGDWETVFPIKYEDDLESPEPVKIDYGRTAFIHTTRETLDQVAQYLNGWANGDENQCISIEELTEWLADEEAFDVPKDFVEYIQSIVDSLEKGFDGDIIFCR